MIGLLRYTPEFDYQMKLALQMNPIPRPLVGNHGLYTAYLEGSINLHRNAAFTPDTCSRDTSCIHLYPFVSPVAVYNLHAYPVLATKLSLTRHYGDMYPLVSGYKLPSGILVSGCMYLV